MRRLIVAVLALAGCAQAAAPASTQPPSIAQLNMAWKQITLEQRASICFSVHQFGPGLSVDQILDGIGDPSLTRDAVTAWLDEVC